MVTERPPHGKSAFIRVEFYLKRFREHFGILEISVIETLYVEGAFLFIPAPDIEPITVSERQEGFATLHAGEAGGQAGIYPRLHIVVQNSFQPIRRGAEPSGKLDFVERI